MRVILYIFLAFSYLIALPASAQVPQSDLPNSPVPSEQEITSSQMPTQPDNGEPQLTYTDVSTWLDGYMPYALDRGGIVGAVIVIVKDGEILLQRGYGYSDLEKRLPVDPEDTLFRPGSVSKLFTWTAVMQLVEDGKVDLDEDINTYLDYEIPPYKGKPITMRHIMTHTAGFEEHIKGLISQTEDQIRPLGDYLKAGIPARIFEPGTMPAYSNYATGVAGYVVERVSGEPFDTYIDNHIFKPLNMDDSSFSQPLPGVLMRKMSKGYKALPGPSQPYELVNPAPAGSLAASGADMGKFMIAHLQNGMYLGERILSDETARQMHDTTFEVVPPLNMMALGFYQSDINGERVISHGGDTTLFHSDLNLFLDQNVGVYISMNSSGVEGASGNIRTALFDMFAERYFPGPGHTGAVDENIAKKHAAQIAGTYTVSRRLDKSFMSVQNLFGQIKVMAQDDGTVIVPFLTSASGKPKVWQEISPYVWKEKYGNQRLAAKVVDGDVVMWSVDAFAPTMMFHPVSASKSSTWLVPFTYFSLIVLLLTAIFWPVGKFVRWRYNSPLILEKRPALARNSVKTFSWLTLLVLAGWVTAISTQFSTFNFSASFDLIYRVLQVLTLIVFLGMLFLSLWNAWYVWTSKRRWPSKLWSIALVLASVGLVYVSTAYHLIGFNLNY